MKRAVIVVQFLALVALAAFVVLLFRPGDSVDVADADAEVQAGAVVFAERCASCHGAQGEGGTGPDLTDVASRYPEVADQVAVVTNGQGGMPAFGGDLQPDEINAVVRFTREGL